MDDQFYVKGDKKYDRVSNIVGIIHDSGLEGFWRSMGFRHADEVMRKKADRGRRFHDLVNAYCFNLITPETMNMLSENQPDLWTDLTAVTRYMENARLSMEIGEKTLYSEKNGYAGTFDGLIKRPDGKRILIDLKLAVKNFKHEVQIGGYGKLLTENNIDFDLCELWYVSKGKLKVVEVGKEKSMLLFMHALNIYRSSNG